jgi:hypothetical protein
MRSREREDGFQSDSTPPKVGNAPTLPARKIFYEILLRQGFQISRCQREALFDQAVDAEHMVLESLVVRPAVHWQLLADFGFMSHATIFRVSLAGGHSVTKARVALPDVFQV